MLTTMSYRILRNAAMFSPDFAARGIPVFFSSVLLSMANDWCFGTKGK